MLLISQKKKKSNSRAATKPAYDEEHEVKRMIIGKEENQSWFVDCMGYPAGDRPEE